MAQPGGIGFDFSDLDRLVADLAAIPREAIPNVRKAVEVTSRHIKDDWISEAKRSNPSGSHAARYPYSVDYDLKLGTDGEIGSEIGPNLGRAQGQFGFLEAAGGGVRAAPQRNKDRATKKNLADFEKGLLKATEGLL